MSTILPSHDHRRGPRGPRRLAAAVCAWMGLLCLLTACHVDQAGRGPQDSRPQAAGQPLPSADTATTPAVEHREPPVSWADYERAVTLYTEGHYHEARLLLARIYKTKLTPQQNRSLRFLAGLTAYRLGLAEETERYLSGDGKVPPSLAGYALFIRGRARFGAGRYQTARELLARFIREHPDSPWTREAELTSVEALFYLNRPQDALNECRALMKNDTGGQVSLLMARLYEGMGRLETARAYYKQAMGGSKQRTVRAEAAYKYRLLLMKVVEKPGHEDEKLELVSFLRREWRLDDALSLIDRLKSAGGSQNFLAQLNSQKAGLLFYSGRITQAMDYYRGGGGQGRLDVRPVPQTPGAVGPGGPGVSEPGPGLPSRVQAGG